MNQITFTLTSDDLIAAQLLHQRTIVQTMISIVILFLVALLIAHYGLKFDEMNCQLFAFVGVILGLLISWIGAIRWWVAPRVALRLIQEDPQLSKVLHMTWDDATLTLETESSRSKTNWSDFIGWKSNSSTILLYRQTHLFHPIPTSAFAGITQIQSMIDALQLNRVPNRWPPK